MPPIATARRSGGDRGLEPDRRTRFGEIHRSCRTPGGESQRDPQGTGMRNDDNVRCGAGGILPSGPYSTFQLARRLTTGPVDRGVALGKSSCEVGRNELYVLEGQALGD